MIPVYLRDLDDTTLADLVPELDKRLTIWGGGVHEIECNLDDDAPTLRLGQHEMAASRTGVLALASHCGIPVKFFDKLERDEKQFLLASRLQHTGGDLTAEWNDQGIYDVYKAGQTRVQPHRLIEAALATFPEESPVVDWWCDADDMRVDVIVPMDFDRWVGGDPKVNDLTHGGIRFGQDRKNNLAPWVQPLLYRLVCTNGMEVPDLGLKVDARQASVEEIEALFEGEIRRAVDRLESDIQHFYSLREEKIDSDPTGALRRSALEQKLPLRTVGNLEDQFPGYFAEDGTATMFDVVNLMTNQANDPSIGLRSSTRRNLQRAGGGLVHDHAERCSACHSRLG
jgi:hypothetical protein